MLKAVCLIIFLLTFSFMQNSNFINHENVIDCFSNVTSINIYIDNEKSSFSKDDDEFSSILSALNSLTNESHEMPAFSVSLDYETKKAIKSGAWLELNFNCNHAVNDMPFSSLLIEVDESFYGFNLIRKYSGKYEGRCFYLNLNDKNMSSLYSILTSLQN